MSTTAMLVPTDMRYLMSDTLTVRAPCKHGLHDQHVIDPTVRHSFGNLCPGGREIVLRPDQAYDGQTFKVWIEIPKEYE